MKLPIFCASAIVLTVGACGETNSVPNAEVDPITAAIAGKSLVIGDIRFFNGSDGTLTGQVGDEEYVGVWTVRDGKICNQFSKPARFSNPQCFNTKLNDDGTITIGSRGGRDFTWTIE